METVKAWNKTASTITFTGWIASSYLCQFFSSLSLHTFRETMDQKYHRSWLSPLIVTVLQLLTFISLVDVSCLRQQKLDLAKTRRDGLETGKQNGLNAAGNSAISPSAGSAKEISVILIISYISAVYVTNVSISLLPVEVVLVIKLTEPMVYAVLSKIVSGSTISSLTPLSLLTVCGGAFWYAKHTTHNPQMNSGVILSLLSVVFLVVRDICIQGLRYEDSLFSPRPVRYRVVLCVVIVSVSLVYFATGSVWVPPSLLAVFSSLFYLFNLFVPTAILASSISTFCHAVATIAKKEIVVVMLTVARYKKLPLMSVASLAVCSAGLLLYVRGLKFRGEEKTEIQVSLSEQFNRLTFILYLTIVFGLVFYNIPLNLSHRDIENFSKLTGHIGQ